MPERLCHAYRVQQDYQCEVICYLRVVGLDLKTQEKSESRRAESCVRQPPFLLQGYVPHIRNCRKHPREEGYGLHLGVVPHLYNLEVIRAESYGDGTSYRYQRVYSEREHQKPRAQKRNEKICGRSFACHQKIVEPLRPVTFGGSMNRGCGHASEHGFCPCRLVVRVSRIPFHHFV